MMANHFGRHFAADDMGELLAWLDDLFAVLVYCILRSKFSTTFWSCTCTTIITGIDANLLWRQSAAKARRHFTTLKATQGRAVWSFQLCRISKSIFRITDSVA
eukprot:Skav224926  [mRNA]  locus=scaffold2105:42992:44879:- [translate_table: standard]